MAICAVDVLQFDADLSMPSQNIFVHKELGFDVYDKVAAFGRVDFVVSENGIEQRVHGRRAEDVATLQPDSVFPGLWFVTDEAFHSQCHFRCCNDGTTGGGIRLNPILLRELS